MDRIDNDNSDSSSSSSSTSVIEQNHVIKSPSSSSSSYSTSTGTSDRNRDRGSNGSSREEEPLVYNETVAVARSKWCVYVVLLMVAAATGCVVNRLTSHDVKEDFRKEFESLGHEILDVAENNIQIEFGIIKSLSTSLTSFAQSSQKTWPQVTLPDFEERSDVQKDISGAETIAFAPLVSSDQKASWEEYALNHYEWIKHGLAVHGLDNLDTGGIHEHIHGFDCHGSENDADDLAAARVEWPDTYLPLWQMGGAPVNATIVNGDLLTETSFSRVAKQVLRERRPLLSEITNLYFLYKLSNDRYMERNASASYETVEDDEHPRSYILQPIFESFEEDAEIVGFAIAIIPWSRFFDDALPPGSPGIILDLHDTCGAEFTYLVDGDGAHPLHDQPDASSRKYRRRYDLASSWSLGDEVPDSEGGAACRYWFDVAPSDALRATYDKKTVTTYTATVLLVFVFTILVFGLYDTLVQRRQEKIMKTAQRTTAIVSSLFPKSVKKRIMEEAQADTAAKHGILRFAPKHRIKEFLDDVQLPDATEAHRPIADFFTDCTIMFADLVGFTAWSSTREPSHVFTLLESIFSAFDEIAQRRRVFKVETVGDCYVAVCGLPDARKDHAVVMARFARDCMHRMHAVAQQLELVLGPDTTELGLRVGLHSGPVTAGVLRGERARFQLFGDTVNTASRMESTGLPNKIQVSEATANILTEFGKGQWVHPRSEKITAKGKGELQTYFLEFRGESAKSSRSSTTEGSEAFHEPNDVVPAVGSGDAKAAQKASLLSSADLSDKEQRLVEWNTTLLMNFVKKIVVHRKSCGHVVTSSPEKLLVLEQELAAKQGSALDEVVETVHLPRYQAMTGGENGDALSAEDEEILTEQMRSYVQMIAALYRSNPFHGFEHASHVTMSTSKLLSRIVAPTELDTSGDVAKDLHDHTYGITSDPLTQFAVTLAALIHDVDHPGVPNSQLVKEGTTLAGAYKNKSVAEQNSLDIGWNLLMDKAFTRLRRTIYASENELRRFRALLVNVVLATDIMDKDLNVLRRSRWDKAFSESAKTPSDLVEDSDRKATIVLEHLIQASDVAHTMQHWHIYRKWNTRLFMEAWKAYKAGRSDQDPCLGWYEGEKRFLDFYVIPLARKLADCGVFGVSSDEYLSYAVTNRVEWEAKGEELVESMIERCNAPVASEES